MQADTASPLESLADRLCALRYENLDETVRDAARQRVFDTLSAAAIGLMTAEGERLRSLDRQLATLAGSNRAIDQCRLLVSAARTTEIDDIDIQSCTTVGSVVVPVAICIASSGDKLDDRDLLLAIVAGYEAMTRLGRAVGGATLLYRGVWPTYVTAAFGAAATTAKLLGLDARHTKDALGMALSRSRSISRAALSAPAYRYYALGSAAADGCIAALAAASGLRSGNPEPAEFAETIGAAIDERQLSIGDPAPAGVQAVDTKPFPTSRQALASIEAFTSQLPLPDQAADIERIAVYVPAPYRDMVDQPAVPGERIASMLGVQYAMALAAVGSATFFDTLRRTLPGGAAIEALMAKIGVFADEELTSRFPGTWGSRVSVHWKSGAATTTEVLEPAGSARKPLDWNGLLGKVERILEAGSLCPNGAARDILTGCRNLGVNAGASSGSELLGAMSLLCGR